MTERPPTSAARTAGTLRIVDLETHEVVGNVDLGTNTMPDTLQLSANEKLLTVGLRSLPAQIAMVDTATLHFTEVTIGAPGTDGAGTRNLAATTGASLSSTGRPRRSCFGR